MLALALTGWGCQQPPYYFNYGYGTGAPACVPVVPAPAAPSRSNGGEPPTEVIDGGMTSTAAPSQTTTVIGSQAPQRVVVSQPDDTPRTSWRPNPNPNPDPVVATTVEGAIRRTDADSTTTE